MISRHRAEPKATDRECLKTDLFREKNTQKQPAPWSLGPTENLSLFSGDPSIFCRLSDREENVFSSFFFLNSTSCDLLGICFDLVRGRKGHFWATKRRCRVRRSACCGVPRLFVLLCVLALRHLPPLASSQDRRHIEVRCSAATAYSPAARN